MNALSKLKNLMRKRNISRSGLADELGVAKSLVTMWFEEDRTPGLRTAILIEDWSGGEILSREWTVRKGGRKGAKR